MWPNFAPPEEKAKIDVIFHYNRSRMMRFWPSAFAMQTDFLKVLGPHLAQSLGLVDHHHSVAGDSSEYTREQLLGLLSSWPAIMVYVAASLVAMADHSSVMDVRADLTLNWFLTLFFLVEFALHTWSFGAKWSYGGIFFRQQVSVLVEVRASLWEEVLVVRASLWEEVTVARSSS